MCRAKVKFDKSSTDSVELLPHLIDSDAAFLPYLIHQLGSALHMTEAASESGLTILYPSVKMATGLFYFIFLFVSLYLLCF